MKKIIGFVYIWHDKKKRPNASLGRWCIGSHMGDPNGRYKSSTGHFKNAYRLRKSDFRRKFLFVMYEGTRDDLYKEEQRWIDMIKPEEFGVKYYNTKPKAFGGVGQKKGFRHSDEAKAAISKANLGKVMDYESRKKMSVAGKGRKKTEEHKQKIGEAHKGSEKPYMVEANKNPEKIRKTAEKHRGMKRSNEAKAKMSAAKIGRPPTNKGIPARRVICPHCGAEMTITMMTRTHSKICIGS